MRRTLVKISFVLREGGRRLVRTRAPHIPPKIENGENK